MSLTKREAFIISGYTDVLMLPFDEYHKMVDEQLGRHVWIHEMASSEFVEEIRESLKPEFLKLCIQTD